VYGLIGGDIENTSQIAIALKDEVIMSMDGSI
jgi:hypothetical protein